MGATPVAFATIVILGSATGSTATGGTPNAGMSAGSASGHTVCAATGAWGVGDAYLTDEDGVRLQDEGGEYLMTPGVSSDLLDIDMATRSAGGI